MARSFYLQGRLSRHTWQTPPTRGRTQFDDGFVVLVVDKTHGRHYMYTFVYSRTTLGWTCSARDAVLQNGPARPPLRQRDIYRGIGMNA